jgi:hypothetical protein
MTTELVQVSLAGGSVLDILISYNTTVDQLIASLLKEHETQINVTLCGIKNFDRETSMGQFGLRRLGQREHNKDWTGVKLAESHSSEWRAVGEGTTY